MSRPPEDQWRPPEPPNRSPRPNGARPPTPRPRWMMWVVVGVLITALLVWKAAPGGSASRAEIDYSRFLSLVEDEHVANIKYESSSGKITGEFKGGFTEDDKSEFTTQGQPGGFPEPDVNKLDDAGVGRDY
jgi:hypothetical protein